MGRGSGHLQALRCVELKKRGTLVVPCESDQKIDHVLGLGRFENVILRLKQICGRVFIKNDAKRIIRVFAVSFVQYAS